MRICETGITILAVALSWGSCIAQEPPVQEQTAKIVGEIVVQYGEGAPFPSYAGKVFPDDNFPVYLFAWQESGVIRDMLKKLERDTQAAREDPENSDKWWMVEKRMEDIHKLVNELTPSQRTKTDEKGHFAFEGLKPGEKYLVVAIDLVYETGFILHHQVVGPLKAGKTDVRFVEKIG